MACLQKLLRLNTKIFKYTTQLNRFNSTYIQKIASQTQIPINFPLLSQWNNHNNNINHWIYQQNDKVESPLSIIIKKDVPIVENKLPLFDPLSIRNLDVVTPGTEETKQEKLAVRLIVIRRHKMRKHKLRKLRKKMKFEWAKRRQRRELRKEKEFQAGLIAQIKEAEAFSAEQYVAERLQKATEVPIPRFWKGKRLPEFIIRQKLGLPPKPQ